MVYSPTFSEREGTAATWAMASLLATGMALFSKASTAVATAASIPTDTDWIRTCCNVLDPLHGRWLTGRGSSISSDYHWSAMQLLIPIWHPYFSMVFQFDFFGDSHPIIGGVVTQMIFKHHVRPLGPKVTFCYLLGYPPHGPWLHRHR